MKPKKVYSNEKTEQNEGKAHAHLHIARNILPHHVLAHAQAIA
jgi:hypothetical protein